jgi:hypothetical protein
MAMTNPPTSPTEDFEATIPAPGASGTYYYYPYGWDDVPNYNSDSPEYATLIITDETMPPEVSNVLLNGAATQTYPLSAIPVLTLTATIDDSSTGNSDIGGANYTEGVQNWPSTAPMALQNPPTSPTEIFEATIPAPGAVGTYTYYVYGWDIQPNYNTTNVLEFVTLTITDDLAPTISNVLINGAASQTYDIASIPPLLLTATVDDSSTGNSGLPRPQ